MITQPWSHIDDPCFLRLVKEMRRADITILNLETLIHEYRGYAQLDSGGAYMASPPAIARELKWAGVDMVSHANNHAFDYGSEGIMETHSNMVAADIVIAGSGKDLQAARAPRYFLNGDTTVALISMTASFVPYGVASPSRPDLHGRPGVNPLEVRKNVELTLTPRLAGALYKIMKRVSRYPERYGRPVFRVHGIGFSSGKTNNIFIRRRIRHRDFGENLASIEQGVQSADLAVVSIHSHQTGPWLRKFCHAALGAGADVVFIHGPHEIRGIELHAGRPIFHGMGNFVYQTDQIERLPAEAYERIGLNQGTTIEEFHVGGRRFPMQRSRKPYEAFAAVLNYSDGGLKQIRLLPVDLQFDAAYRIRGRPQYAEPEFGRRIIAEVSKLSSRFGTRIEYDSEMNQGLVVI